MLFEELIVIVVTGNERKTFAKLARRFQMDMDGAEKIVIFLFNLFDLMVRVADMFEIIGRVKKMRIKFDPLQIHHRPINEGQTNQKKDHYNVPESTHWNIGDHLDGIC